MESKRADWDPYKSIGGQRGVSLVMDPCIAPQGRGFSSFLAPAIFQHPKRKAQTLASSMVVPGMSSSSFTAALQEIPTGVRLELHVAPGARSACFPDRYDPWRKRIGIRVQAPAEGGKANQEVIRLVAGFFEQPTSRVTIGAGQSTSLKSVLIAGVTLPLATRRLAGELT